jgi:hypothetical protein
VPGGVSRCTHLAAIAGVVDHSHRPEHLLLGDLRSRIHVVERRGLQVVAIAGHRGAPAAGEEPGAGLVCAIEHQVPQRT